MSDPGPFWKTPEQFISKCDTPTPVSFLSPQVLQNTARAMIAGFPGMMTYAVKANPAEEVLANLIAAGVGAFDVASPQEMRLVKGLCPEAQLHYHNPVRDPGEIKAGIKAGVASWSVDDAGELAKLGEVPRGCEVAVRFALPVKGAAYDFGAKFGADPHAAADLLRRVVREGFTPALTFHPGTQCADPNAWGSYIREAARIAEKAGVQIATLNVGGGFPAQRGASPVGLSAHFEKIGAEVRTCFATRPKLVAEPGRAMVSESVTLGCQVKARRGEGVIFVNDGIYGNFGEAPSIGLPDRWRLIAPDGAPRPGAKTPWRVFGPTCDSLDQLPDPVMLPCDLAPGDWLLLDGMGAYSSTTASGFNGYGQSQWVTVDALR